MSYQPLGGVKVLDLGILIPAALTSGKLAALGADVVKVEQPPYGDRIRAVPPYGTDGESPQHMAQNWGKRSIGLDVRVPADRDVILALARRADVIIENQLADFWTGAGVDLGGLRAERPGLIVCSITGFGQTGPWSRLPSHGLNMDALGDTLNIDWDDGAPHCGWTFTSWGNELGTSFAATAICALRHVPVQRRDSDPAGHVGTQVLAALLRAYRPPGSCRPAWWRATRVRRRRRGAGSGADRRVRQSHGSTVAFTIPRVGRPGRPGTGRTGDHGDRSLPRPRDHRARRGRLAERDDGDPLATHRWPGRRRTGPATGVRRRPRRRAGGLAER